MTDGRILNKLALSMSRGIFIPIFRAMLTPVINITVFGEIVKFGTPNL